METAIVQQTPAREFDLSRQRQAYAVWELTLKCNLACGHCGSRAGKARENELSTEEALDLVRQMAELGITEVTIEGGEAYLRPDWLDIARAITAHGMICTMVTGGYGVSRETARRMKDAGISAVTVSVDGLEETHNKIRGRERSFERCFETFKHLKAAGIEFHSNTQINRLSAPELPRLYERLRDAGIWGWQIQLTSAMGNAADRVWMLMQPAELDDLFRMLARIGRRADVDGVHITPGNNLGYHGRFEDVIFKNSGRLWAGCMAGLGAIGIHADGSIKGCPTLPSEYIGGNIRDKSLAEIAESRELTINMNAGTETATEHLWGFCASCPHARSCRGGCMQTATVTMGKKGNNPYCHYRAQELAKLGKRERVVPRLLAIGKPFDHGALKIVEEAVDAPWPAHDELHFTYDKVVWPDGWEADPEP